MHLQPIVDQPVTPMPLDPIGAMLYVAVFIVVTLATMRRPVLGASALLLLQPFAFYRDIFNTTITLPKVALAGVLLALAASPKVFAYLRERNARQLLLAGALIVFATMLSIAVATYAGPAFREALKQVYYVIIFVAVYVCYRLDPERALVTACVAAATIGVSLLALSQEVLGAPSAFIVGGHPLPRIAGALEGPNQLAGYLEIAVPFLFASLMWRSTPLVQAGLFFGLFADILTFSRSGTIGCIVAIVIVIAIVRRNPREPLFIAIAGALSGTIVASFWGYIAHVSSISRFWNFSESNYAGGVGTRSELWKAAAVLWHRHPLLGVGAGNFELDLPEAGLHGIRTHANSLYLQSLVEGGIPLLAATVFLFYSTIATLVRRAASSPIAVAALASTIALALHQAVDDVFFYPKVGGFWWAVVALGAVEVSQAGRTAE
ncbi:MAG: O-antigen ligase family protein [Candidatus Eremiobacteraeota bacterium]|nr:O-antigen ligase family protein [Candidatus Eremiobacteraeota bacterium]